MHVRETIAYWLLHAYALLLPIAQVVAAALVFVVFPLSLVPSLRARGGWCFMWGSYIFGLLTWLLAAGITFVGFGWFGRIIGLLIAGVGVVPLGVLAAFVKSAIPSSVGWSILGLCGVTFLARGISVLLIQKAIKALSRS